MDRELTLDDDLSWTASAFTPPPRYVRLPRAAGSRPWLSFKLNADTVYYYRLSHSTPTHFVYVKSTRLEAAKGGAVADPYTASATSRRSELSAWAANWSGEPGTCYLYSTADNTERVLSMLTGGRSRP